MLAILIISDGLSCMIDLLHFYVLTLTLLFNCVSGTTPFPGSPHLHQGAEYTSHPCVPSAHLSAQVPAKCQYTLLSGVMLLWPLLAQDTGASCRGSLRTLHRREHFNQAGPLCGTECPQEGFL